MDATAGTEIVTQSVSHVVGFKSDKIDESVQVKEAPAKTRRSEGAHRLDKDYKKRDNSHH